MIANAFKDDRDALTPRQRRQFTHAVGGRDRFMSNLGNVDSFAYWACHADDSKRVLDWVKDRGDISHPRVIAIDDIRAAGRHVHLYVVKPGHPALDGNPSNSENLNRAFAQGDDQ